MANAGRYQKMRPSVFFSRGALEAKCGILRQGFHAAGFHGVEGPPHEPRPQFREPGFQLHGRFFGIDVARSLGDARAGIDAGSHVDDRHAGLPFAVVNRPIDRRRAAIFRQQRRMKIDSPHASRGQGFRRENLPVIADDHQIGIELREPDLRLGRR